jgi:nitrogen fixation protein FixH
MSSASAGRPWIVLVVAILSAVVVSNVVLMRVAGADPSVAMEPDAWRKAQAWDARVAQAQRSAKLGWSLRVEALGLDGSDLATTLRLTDADGAPVEAAVDVEAFAIARSGARLELRGRTDAAGRILLRGAGGREGLWELRVRAERGADVFVTSLRESVAAAAS